ncbi:MAG TPA: IS200/IS605 family transposase [Nevskiaceae bacterium]|nr:IS200/IS605 family transposase [Nevskiaceae bacterium]
MPDTTDTSTLRTASHAAFRLYYHVIFAVKYRHKCITAGMLARLEVVFSEVLAKWRCRLVEFGGEADHVHLLIDAHPALDLSRMIGNLKTVSARRMRVEYAEHLRPFFWKPYFWNRAYAVISVGGRAPLETLLKYIESQDSPPPAPLD